MILFWKISLQIISVGIVLFVSILDYVKSDRRTNIYKRVRLGLFILALGSLVVNIFIVIDDEQSKQKEVADLKQEIALLHQKSDSTNNILTGGNSFCYLTPIHVDENTILFMLNKSGNYPLNDISIDVIKSDELDEADDENSKRGSDFEQGYSTHYSFPSVGNEGIKVGKFNLTGTDKKTLRVKFRTRFKSFLQVIQLAKVESEWIKAYRVYEVPEEIKYSLDGAKLAFEYIDPRFPADKDGKIIWK